MSSFSEQHPEIDALLYEKRVHLSRIQEIDSEIYNTRKKHRELQKQLEEQKRLEREKQKRQKKSQKVRELNALLKGLINFELEQSSSSDEFNGEDGNQLAIKRNILNTLIRKNLEGSNKEIPPSRNQGSKHQDI